MLNSARKPITRWQAAGVHVLCSLGLAVIAGILLFMVWFPQPFTHAAGADRLITLLIGIDLVLGPLLTLIVYKHGKKGMYFDLAFIGVVQVAALTYGLHMIAQSRPIFIVVTEDMTYLVPNRALSEEDLAQAPDAALRHRSWTGPVLVAAPTPTDPKAREALLDSGLAGKDIDRLPQHYRIYAQAAPALIAASKPLAELAAVEAKRERVQAFVRETGKDLADMRFQALRGSNPDLDTTVVFEPKRAEVLGVIDVDPWQGAAK